MIFAINRSTTASIPLEVDLRSHGLTIIEATSYSHSDPYWEASADDATTVLPVANPSATVTSEGGVSADLPPVSWNMLRLGRA